MCIAGSMGFSTFESTYVSTSTFEWYLISIRSTITFRELLLVDVLFQFLCIFAALDQYILHTHFTDGFLLMLLNHEGAFHGPEVH